MVKRLHLTDISSLTLKRGRMTSARRAAAVPQLECEGRFCDVGAAKQVECENIGIDENGEILWQCMSDDLEYDFSSLSVQCEGWDRPGDDWVLAGSCGLTYTLKRPSGDRQRYAQTGRNSSQNWGGSLFNVVFYGVLLWIILTFLRSCMRPTRTQQTPPGPPRGPFPGWFSGWFSGFSGSSGSNSGGKENASSGWSSYIVPAAVSLGGILLANSFNSRSSYNPNYNSNYRDSEYDWERRRAPSNYGGGGRSASGVASTSRSR